MLGFNPYAQYFADDFTQGFVQSWSNDSQSHLLSIRKIMQTSLPNPVIIQIGDDEFTKGRVESRIKMCRIFGLEPTLICFPAKEGIIDDLRDAVNLFANHERPISIQYPYAWRSNQKLYQEIRIRYLDIEGIFSGSVVMPCKAKGVMKHLEFVTSQVSERPLNQLNMLTIDRSIFESPLANLARRKGMTVMQLTLNASSSTRNSLFSLADVIMTEVSLPSFIKASDADDYLRPNVMIYDAGMVRLHAQNKLVGDCEDFASKGYAVMAVNPLETQAFMENLITIYEDYIFPDAGKEYRAIQYEIECGADVDY